jgi:hypothetical protein
VHAGGGVEGELGLPRRLGVPVAGHELRQGGQGVGVHAAAADGGEVVEHVGGEEERHGVIEPGMAERLHDVAHILEDAGAGAARDGRDDHAHRGGRLVDRRVAEPSAEPVQLCDGLRLGEALDGTVEALADAAEVGQGDDAAEGAVLAGACAHLHVHVGRVGPPAGRVLVHLGGGGRAEEGAVEPAVVDAGGDEPYVGAVGQLAGQGGVVSVGGGGDVDVEELPAGGDTLRPADALEAFLEVASQEAECLAAGTADADEKESA